MIRYCFEKGATHPKYNLHKYNTIILPDKIKDLFEYYENQIEEQFDFTKYELLKTKDKKTVKKILLANRKKETVIRTCIISDVLNLFSVKDFI